MRKSTKLILIIVATLVTLFAIFAIIQVVHFTRFRQPSSIASDTTVVGEVIDTVAHAIDEDTLQAEDSRAIYEQSQFPKTGNLVKDFVIEPYKIVMEDEGLLDQDNLKDVVITLQNKNDSTDVRPTLVLLKQQTGGYQLYGVSWETVPPAYREDFQEYLAESLEIDGAKLKISLTGYGAPTGNRFKTYKFIDHKLVLISIGLFNAGAGGQSYVDVDYLKNSVRYEDVNTMLDEMPSTVTHEKIKKHKPYFFETDEGLDFRRDETK
ncbi:hypothetical protein GJU39_10765 [Pedobacter petrophilus]|uniref:Uncharacterized protein n=1 Tax=Pedobacter petrophilus TaxID=1908241 RepID=A0A7K0FY96_9SPHI|nr:hypothetical protein [Pedobacter petrophilus]MRX76573.1 hypothetical protein [Pedobacter petrophilus]